MIVQKKKRIGKYGMFQMAFLGIYAMPEAGCGRFVWQKKENLGTVNYPSIQ